MKKQRLAPELAADRGKRRGYCRKRFAKISAVEGIELAPEMKRRAAEFDRKKLSPKQRIDAIVARTARADSAAHV